jgi:hypothetical protein
VNETVQIDEKYQDTELLSPQTQKSRKYLLALAFTIVMLKMGLISGNPSVAGIKLNYTGHESTILIVISFLFLGTALSFMVNAYADFSRFFLAYNEKKGIKQSRRQYSAYLETKRATNIATHKLYESQERYSKVRQDNDLSPVDFAVFDSTERVKGTEGSEKYAFERIPLADILTAEGNLARETERAMRAERDMKLNFAYTIERTKIWQAIIAFGFPFLATLLTLVAIIKG